jgi:hypothetical protein
MEWFLIKCAACFLIWLVLALLFPGIFLINE